MMQQLYVPEIGDSFKLAEDWSFELHDEYRNEDLGVAMGYRLERGFISYPDKQEVLNGWISNEVPIMRPVDYMIEYPRTDDPRFKKTANFRSYVDTLAYNQACEEARLNNPEYVKWNADNIVYRHNIYNILKTSSKLIVTLPAGTVLSVDRIYIRKGKGDYSSITFYAKGFKEITKRADSMKPEKMKKQKALRFWATLSDCNKLKFDSVLDI